MAYFQFLGTGPSTPITDATGRNFRLRSSGLMQHIATYLMLDVTHDFDQQIEMALSVTHVCVTNPSRDAAGGLGNLERWTEHPVPLCVPADLYKELLSRYGPMAKLPHLETPALTPVQVGDLLVVAFPVETTPGADAPPSYGYRFDNGKKKVCYASDVKHVPEVSMPYMRGNDLLIVDAAGWDKDLPTHRGALNHLHDYVSWGNEQVLFTDVGRSAPPHTLASSTVRRLSHKADVAYASSCRSASR
jgi:phosphoribosyl 1,2-cyclic phosphodiesterase